MIDTILWDVDATLLNFEKAESYAIRKCFEGFGFGECTDEMLASYSAVNSAYWRRLELGELSKAQVLSGRFLEFFQSYGIPTDKVSDFNLSYQVHLGDEVFFNDNALHVLNALKGRVRQYAVTNGTKLAQDRKLERSGIAKIMDGIFISEVVGAEKPSRDFFRSVWQDIGRYDPCATMIVGDSLTSDMQGGNNEGIICCWYNPQGKPNATPLKIDYEIPCLDEVIRIVG